MPILRTIDRDILGCQTELTFLSYRLFIKNFAFVYCRKSNFSLGLSCRSSMVSTQLPLNTQCYRAAILEYKTLVLWNLKSGTFHIQLFNLLSRLFLKRETIAIPFVLYLFQCITAIRTFMVL